MKALVKKIVSALGYEITKKSSRKIGYEYDFEAEANQAISIVRQNTMVSYEPLVTLFQQIHYCELQGIIHGDYVECGVWKGGAVGLMVLANKEYSQKRRHIYMFDIFDDICEPDPKVDGDFVINNVAKLAGVDKLSLKGRLRLVKGVYNSHGGHGTIEIVKKLIEDKIGYDKKFLHYHKGWFQETLPDVAKEIKQIAILRLDGDFHASTKVCLDILYDKVVSRGFIIIDDYGTRKGCRKAVDEFRERKEITAFINHVNQDCKY